MAERRSSAQIFAILTALFVSIGLHGLVLLLVWFTPARAMPRAGNGLSVQLVSHSSSIRPSSRQAPQNDHEEEESHFSVSTLAPAPAYPNINNKDPELSVGSASKGPGEAPSGGGTAQSTEVGTGAGKAAQPTSGTGGGSGKKWFPDAENARSVVYAIDRSLSMGTDSAFVAARRAVVDSLRHLPPGTRFQIIPYNRKAEPLTILGRTTLVEIGEDTIHDAARVLELLEAFGNTDHGAALARGLALKPDILYLVTDGGDLNPALVEALTKKNRTLTGGRTVIHTVEVGHWQGPTVGRPLQVLAQRNQGNYQLLAPTR